MLGYRPVSQEGPEVEKIWLDILIEKSRVGAPFSYNLFAISTPSPLKMALKMTNIVKIAILAKYEYFLLTIEEFKQI